MVYDPDLIITTDNRHDVIRDLRMRDWPMASLVIATNVQLANMYHSDIATPSPSDIQRATSQAILDTIAAMGAPMPLVLPPGSTYHYRTPLVVKVVSLGHAVMLVGPAGCGKTTIAEHAAQALQLPFYITNVINETHELTGFLDGYGKYHGTPFRTAFEHGGLWIADEIDAWLARVWQVRKSVMEKKIRHVVSSRAIRMGADALSIGIEWSDVEDLYLFKGMSERDRSKISA